MAVKAVSRPAQKIASTHKVIAELMVISVSLVPVETLEPFALSSSCRLALP